MENRVAQAIPQATLDAALEKIRSAAQDLAPHLFTLSPKEREEMPKMGDKSVPFVTKSAEFAGSLSDLMPGYINVADLKIDAGVFEGLMPHEHALVKLLADVISTRMVAGSEGYSAALLVYATLQTAARGKLSGAEAAVEELKPRFAAQGRRKGGQ